jgi:hypothetical protein
VSSVVTAAGAPSTLLFGSTHWLTQPIVVGILFKKRTNIAGELLTTERTYVTNLELLVNVSLLLCAPLLLVHTSSLSACLSLHDRTCKADEKGGTVLPYPS